MENNFIYCVDYSKEGTYSCQDYGCEDEGICKCYSIESVNINKIFINRIVDQLFVKKFDINSNSWKRDESINRILFGIDYLYVFYKYCIERILVLNKIYDVNLWTAKWSSGYYGDEVDSISLDSNTFNKIQRDISEIFKLNEVSDMVKFLLQKEYGYILDKIEKCTNYSIEFVDRSQIVFPQKEYQSAVSKKDLSYIDDNKFNICGVCLKELDKYKVIDGYHRLTYFTKKQPKVLIISIC
jgi:hypothetical protein